MMSTSSVKKDKTKIIFRDQASKLNLSAYSGTSVYVCTSGHMMSRALPCTDVTSRVGSCYGGYGYCPGNVLSTKLGVSPFPHPDRMEQRGFFLPGSRTSGAGLNQKASIAMKLIP